MCHSLCTCWDCVFSGFTSFWSADVASMWSFERSETVNHFAKKSLISLLSFTQTSSSRVFIITSCTMCFVFVVVIFWVRKLEIIDCRCADKSVVWNLIAFFFTENECVLIFMNVKIWTYLCYLDSGENLGKKS